MVRTHRNTRKSIATALLVTAAALAASTARADTRVSIGVNLGGPVYAPPPVVAYAPPPTVIYAPPAPRGYWKEVTVKTWVPDRWVMSRDRRGRMVRVCEPGHYVYHTDRVWVEGRGHDGRYGYGRHHDDRRDHSYGYDHRGRGWNR